MKSGSPRSPSSKSARARRAGSNPVDGARVEALTKAAGNRWAADRQVFVNDDAVLLEQGAGRLIRSMSVSGQVAVLDARLLKVGPFPYPDATRNLYPVRTPPIRPV